MVLSWRKFCYWAVCLVATIGLVSTFDSDIVIPTLANQVALGPSTPEPFITNLPQGPLLIVLADESPPLTRARPEYRPACSNEIDLASCPKWIAQHLALNGTNPSGTKFKVNYNPSGACSSGLAAVEPWPDEAKMAFEYALTIWAALIDSSATFTVNACWGPMKIDGALGGAASYALYRDFDVSAQPNTLYPVALANQITGTDINGADPEFYAEFNSRSAWYFGIDQRVPSNQYDFITVVLHEITHGLGFYGSMNVVNNLGEWGFSNSPAAYDLFVIDSNGRRLIDYPNRSQELARVLTGQTGGIFFDGPDAVAANAGAPVKLYAPTVWFSGSSFTHLDGMFDNSPDQLMVHALAIGRSVHNPGPITLGILQDIGWDIDTTFLIPTVTPTPTITQTPTPSATPTSTASPTATPTTMPTLPAPTSGAPLLRIGSVDAQNLDLVVVPLSIAGLSANTALGNMQVELSYDANLLQLSTCTTILSEERRATCIPTSPGLLTIRLANAQELTADSLIAQIRFDINNRNKASATAINIHSTQVTNAAGGTLRPRVENGQIYFGCDLGDVNCDGSSDSVDAQQILQHTIALRDRSNTLPVADGSLHLPACDVSMDGVCGPLDALFIYQCSVGISNTFCASGMALRQEVRGDATKVYLSITPEITAVDQARAPIIATIPDGNLGIMTIDISYDSQWTVSDCIVDSDESFDIAICNPAYHDPDTAESFVRVSFLSASGISGEIKLGEVQLVQSTGQTAALPGPPVMGVEPLFSTDTVGVEVEVLDELDEDASPVSGHQIMLPMVLR